MSYDYFKSLLIYIAQKRKEGVSWHDMNFLENHANAMYDGSNVGEMK